MNDIEERIRLALAPYRLDENLVTGEPTPSQAAPRKPHRRRSRLLVAADDQPPLLVELRQAICGRAQRRDPRHRGSAREAAGPRTRLGIRR